MDFDQRLISWSWIVKTSKWGELVQKIPPVRDRRAEAARCVPSAFLSDLKNLNPNQLKPQADLASLELSDLIKVEPL